MNHVRRIRRLHKGLSRIKKDMRQYWDYGERARKWLSITHEYPKQWLEPWARRGLDVVFEDGNFYVKTYAGEGYYARDEIPDEVLESNESCDKICGELVDKIQTKAETWYAEYKAEQERIARAREEFDQQEYERLKIKYDGMTHESNRSY
jgi:hypothetical protein